MGEWADTKDWDFLPERYFADSRKPYFDRAAPHMREGGHVLDFGGGARPIIAPPMRPPGLTYVGLDVSRDELELAPQGSYDDLIVGDIADGILQPSSFDLVVSWQVLEHVHDMRATLEGIRTALVPGGALVAQMSGRRAFFALLNRVIPDRIGELAMQRLLGREPDSVFRAPYDRCTKSALEEITREWSDVEIMPRYLGTSYLSFSKAAARAYLQYENWALRRGLDDFATHYLLRLVR